MVQPGGNPLNSLIKAGGGYFATKNKFKLQKMVMDYGHQQALERLGVQHGYRTREQLSGAVFKGIGKGVETTANSAANRQAYIDAHTEGIDKESNPEEYAEAAKKGAALFQTHVGIVGMKNGVLASDISKRTQDKLYDSMTPTEGKKGKGKGTTNVTDESTPTRTENQFEEVTPAASGAKAFSAPAAVDGSTPHPDEVSEAFTGGHITMGEAADLSPAHARIFNPILKESPDSDAEIDRAHNGPSKPVFGSPLPSLGNAFEPAPTRTPSPFGAINATDVKASVNKAKFGINATPSRIDVAKAYSGGHITSGEANDLIGRNSFGEEGKEDQGYGGKSMDEIHGTTRTAEFGVGQEKE